MSELRAAAAEQHELILVRDLPRVGVTRSQAHRLRASGWLVEVRRGVLLVGGGTPSVWQQVAAASLAAGTASVISHSTAARVHRFVGVAPPGLTTPIDVTVPHNACPKLPGCAVHRVLYMPAADVKLYRAVRVTTPVRTLVDLLPTMGTVLVEKTVDEGLIAHLWDEAGLVAAVERSGGRAGIDRLRKVMAPRSPSSDDDIPLEERAARALTSIGPFERGYQLVLDGRVYILDIAWPEYKVAVECDGWMVRGKSRGKFDHDRRRNNGLVSHGWIVVHLTSAMSDDEMRASVVRVLLRAASARGR